MPNNVFLTIKYSMLPVFFAVLFFEGLNDAPGVIIIAVVLLLTAIELSSIPYDIGKLSEDEMHPYAYKVIPSNVAFLLPVIIYNFIAGKTTRVTKYYSKTGLFLAKLLKVLPWFVILGVFSFFLNEINV